jgi:hypothetical protein
MTCNKNGIPNDPQKPMITSGIRLGSPAFTTRGFKEEQARVTANLIADVLDKPHDEANIAAVRAKVAALTKDFPVYRSAEQGSPSDSALVFGEAAHALSFLFPRRHPGRRDARVRRRGRRAPPAPLPELRQAFHDLRAR